MRYFQGHVISYGRFTSTSKIRDIVNNCVVRVTYRNRKDGDQYDGRETRQDGKCERCETRNAHPSPSARLLRIGSFQSAAINPAQYLEDKYPENNRSSRDWFGRFVSNCEIEQNRRFRLSRPNY